MPNVDSKGGYMFLKGVCGGSSILNFTMNLKLL